MYQLNDIVYVSLGWNGSPMKATVITCLGEDYLIAFGDSESFQNLCCFRVSKHCLSPHILRSSSTEDERNKEKHETVSNGGNWNFVPQSQLLGFKNMNSFYQEITCFAKHPFDAGFACSAAADFFFGEVRSTSEEGGACQGASLVANNSISKADLNSSLVTGYEYTHPFQSERENNSASIKVHHKSETFLEKKNNAEEFKILFKEVLAQQFVLYKWAGASVKYWSQLLTQAGRDSWTILTILNPENAAYAALLPQNLRRFLIHERVEESRDINFSEKTLSIANGNYETAAGNARLLNQFGLLFTFGPKLLFSSSSASSRILKLAQARIERKTATVIAPSASTSESNEKCLKETQKGCGSGKELRPLSFSMIRVQLDKIREKRKKAELYKSFFSELSPNRSKEIKNMQMLLKRPGSQVLEDHSHPVAPFKKQRKDPGSVIAAKDVCKNFSEDNNIGHNKNTNNNNSLYNNNNKDIGDDKKCINSNSSNNHNIYNNNNNCNNKNNNRKASKEATRCKPNPTSFLSEYHGPLKLNSFYSQPHNLLKKGSYPYSVQHTAIKDPPYYHSDFQLSSTPANKHLIYNEFSPIPGFSMKPCHSPPIHSVDVFHSTRLALSTEPRSSTDETKGLQGSYLHRSDPPGIMLTFKNQACPYMYSYQRSRNYSLPDHLSKGMNQAFSNNIRSEHPHSRQCCRCKSSPPYILEKPSMVNCKSLPYNQLHPAFIYSGGTKEERVVIGALDWPNVHKPLQPPLCRKKPKILKSTPCLESGQASSCLSTCQEHPWVIAQEPCNLKK